MNLLLTGFEPFGGDTVNPSELVTRRLDGQTIHGVTIHTALLPVESTQGPETLLRAFERVQPDAVLCLGVAAGRAVLSIERVAINLLDYRIADNAGNHVNDQPIVPGGPAAYFTTLPVRGIHEAIVTAGIPAELSLSAGAFLCNQVLYKMLHFLAEKQLDIPTGFIHLPALPEQAAQKDKGKIPSMHLETIQRGITTAIEVIGH